MQASNIAALNQANATMSLMTLNMGAAAVQHGAAESRIQQGGVEELRENCTEAYLQQEQLFAYADIDGLDLPAEFLYQYYTQVRHFRVISYCGS